MAALAAAATAAVEISAAVEITAAAVEKAAAAAAADTVVTELGYRRCVNATAASSRKAMLVMAWAASDRGFMRSKLGNSVRSTACAQNISKLFRSNLDCKLLPVE